MSKYMKFFSLALVGLFVVLFSSDGRSGEDYLGDEPDRIMCYCYWGACKVSGSGSRCAQSEPGGNIQCSSYKDNC